jgi:glutaminyl-peptide cyclotransferase
VYRTLLSLTIALLFLTGGAVRTAVSYPQSPASSSKAPPPLLQSKSLFDGARAYRHVERLVAIGPRPAGSLGIESARAYLLRELRSYGLTPRLESFSPLTPKGRVEMKNLVVDLPGRSREIILLATHYDTKEFQDFPFVGANDGGSSTGVLLELARILAAQKGAHDLTYRLAFFDGEEAFCAGWSDCLNGRDNTYGSRQMVAQLRKSGEISRIKAMILLDMVGDRDLAIPREENSTAWLVEMIWQTARELGYRRYFPDESHWMSDDHLPFLAAGIPAVDLIDFDYGSEEESYWHTQEDTLDKIDARSLQIVGEVVLASLPRIAAHRP